MPATSPADLLKRMSDLELQTPDTNFIGMFYGPMGTGKTTLAVGLAQRLTKTGRILYLDSSDGWVSLNNFPDLKIGVTRLRYGSYDDIMGIAQSLQKRVKGFEDFDCIVIDEASTIAEGVLDEVIIDKHGSVTEEAEGKDYRPMGQLVMAALNKLHQTEGLHIILVAHDKERPDHRKVIITGPGFSPMLGKSIGKLMHVVGYVSNTITGSANAPVYQYLIQCQPTKLIQAKCRIGGMPVSVEVGDAVEIIAGWVDGTMSTDLNESEVFIEPLDDELPTDGTPVSDNLEEDDDEPAFVEPV